MESCWGHRANCCWAGFSLGILSCPPTCLVPDQRLAPPPLLYYLLIFTVYDTAPPRAGATALFCWRSFWFSTAAFLTQKVQLDDATVKFEIWDTAGQERYRSLAPMYYRGAAAAIVVYDVTNKVRCYSHTLTPRSALRYRRQWRGVGGHDDVCILIRAASSVVHTVGGGVGAEQGKKASLALHCVALARTQKFQRALVLLQSVLCMGQPAVAVSVVGGSFFVFACMSRGVAVGVLRCFVVATPKATAETLKKTRPGELQHAQFSDNGLYRYNALLLLSISAQYTRWHAHRNRTLVDRSTRRPLGSNDPWGFLAPGAAAAACAACFPSGGLATDVWCGALRVPIHFRACVFMKQTKRSRHHILEQMWVQQ